MAPAFHHEQGDVTSINVPIGISLDLVERMVIIATLGKNRGNKQRTAAQLGICPKTLYNKLNRYGAMQ